MKTKQYYKLLRRDVPWYADRKLYSFKTELKKLRSLYKDAKDKQELEDRAKEIKLGIRYLT